MSPSEPGNPWAGEVVLKIGGERRICRLTLGSLAELEAGLEMDGPEGGGSGGLIALVERFETGRFGARDVLAVLLAGLRGGGWRGEAADLAGAELPGGLIGAAATAARLLARAFALPGEEAADRSRPAGRGA